MSSGMYFGLSTLTFAFVDTVSSSAVEGRLLRDLAIRSMCT